MILLKNKITIAGLVNFKNGTTGTGSNLIDYGSVAAAPTSADDYGSLTTSSTSTDDFGLVTDTVVNGTADATFDLAPGTYTNEFSGNISVTNRSAGVDWVVTLVNQTSGTNYGTGSSTGTNVSFGILGVGGGGGSGTFTVTAHDPVLNQTFSWNITTVIAPPTN